MKTTRLIKILIAIFLLSIIGISIAFNNPLKEEVTIEVGESMPSVDQFLLDSTKKAEFITNINKIDTTVKDNYIIEIKVGLFTKETNLRINDSIPPVGKAVNHDIWYDERLEIGDFVTDIKDMTFVNLEYENEPDYNTIGKQSVSILLIDEGNNRSYLEADLMIKEDTKPPNIIGVEDQLVFIDAPVSYRRGIEIVDNKDKNLEFAVDNSNVNLKVPGVYEIIYEATDLAGNKTTKKSMLTIKEKPVFLLSQEELNERADKILKDITYEGMSDLQILDAIFWYTRWHIKYTGQSDKTSWEIGASKALVSMNGDCFNYYSLAHLLLKRANFEFKPVQRIEDSRSRHYWLFVKYGDLWYYFDPTWSPLGYDFDGFMISESEAEAFTERVSSVRENYYVYDKSFFEEIEIAEKPLD